MRQFILLQVVMIEFLYNLEAGTKFVALVKHVVYIHDFRRLF